MRQAFVLAATEAGRDHPFYNAIMKTAKILSRKDASWGGWNVIRGKGSKRGRRSR